MKRLAIVMAVVLLAPFARAQFVPPGALGYCYYAGGAAWIPMLAGGPATTFTPPAVTLYGLNGTTPVAVTCDSSGNITPGGAAGGDLAGTYPDPTVSLLTHVTNAAIPVALTALSGNFNGDTSGDTLGLLGTASVTAVNSGAAFGNLTLTTNGTPGVTHFIFEEACAVGNGELTSAAATITTGNASPNATNSINVATSAAVAGCPRATIYLTTTVTGGFTKGIVGNVATGGTFVYTGQVGDGSTAPAASINTTGTLKAVGLITTVPALNKTLTTVLTGSANTNGDIVFQVMRESDDFVTLSMTQGGTLNVSGNITDVGAASVGSPDCVEINSGGLLVNSGSPCPAGTTGFVGWVDPVLTYQAAGPANIVTYGAITTGTNTLTVLNPAGWVAGMNIGVQNGTSAGVDLLTTVSSVSGNVLTLAANAGNTVLAWSEVYTWITGSGSAGSNTLTVSAYTGWTVGMGIAVHNAGAAGIAELITTVTQCGTSTTAGAACTSATFTLVTSLVSSVTSQPVNHDDTAALTAAIGSGQNVYLEPGNYDVTGALNISTPIRMSGASAGTVTIWNRGTTNHVVELTYVTPELEPTAGAGSVQLAGASVDNLTINQQSGITPTAGYGLVIGSGYTATSMGVSGGLVNNIAINNTYGGVLVNENVIYENIWNIWVTSTLSYGFYWNEVGGYGGNVVDGISLYNTNMYVQQGDTNTISNLYINSPPAAAIIFGPRVSNSTIVNMTFVSPHFEGVTNGNACPLDFTQTTAVIEVKDITLVAPEIEGTKTFTDPSCMSTNVSGFNFSCALTGGRGNSCVSQETGTTSITSLPGDLLCAHAGDTSVLNYAITSGSITSGTAQLGINVQVLHIPVGQQFGILNCTGTACSSFTNFQCGANTCYGPFSETAASYSGNWIQFATSATGTITGGTVYLWCENQTHDATNLYSQYFSKNYLSLGAPNNVGYTHEIAAQLAFWSSSTPAPLAFTILAPGGLNSNNSVTPGASLANKTGEIVWDANYIPSCSGQGSPYSNCWANTMRSMSVPGATYTTLLSANTVPSVSTYNAGTSGVQITPLYTATGIASATYASGGSLSGTGNVTLSSFNNSCSGTTATMAVSGGTAGTITMTNTGQACASAATTASCASGTASCSGTVTLTSALGGAQGNAIYLITLADRP